MQQKKRKLSQSEAEKRHFPEQLQPPLQVRAMGLGNVERQECICPRAERSQIRTDIDNYRPYSCTSCPFLNVNKISTFSQEIYILLAFAVVGALMALVDVRTLLGRSSERESVLVAIARDIPNVSDEEWELMIVFGWNTTGRVDQATTWVPGVFRTIVTHLNVPTARIRTETETMSKQSEEKEMTNQIKALSALGLPEGCTTKWLWIEVIQKECDQCVVQFVHIIMMVCVG